MEPTYSIPSTPLKTPIRITVNNGHNSGQHSLSLSTCKPTPEQNAFNLNMFSEKKKNQYQTPKCPSPPLKSTPASRVNSNLPLIHHISSLSMFSPTTSLSDFMNCENGGSNNIDFSSSFGSSSLNSNNTLSINNNNNNNNNNGGYKIPSSVNKNSNNYNSNSNSNSSNNVISLFDKNFDVVCKLGSGSFSDVFKVKSKFDGNSYAIKQARHQFRGFQERERAVREVKAAVSLPPHTNVLQYYSSWEQNNTLFIQTELCENGSLQDFLDSLSPDQILSEELIWNFLLDVCLGIQHIHSYNMLHLDIKPENLFISSQGNIKIGDFGMAVKLETTNNNNNGNGGCQSNNTSMDSDCNNLSLDEDDIFFDFLEGDSRYLAYEFLLDKKQISKPSDIFSIGVTFFEMVTGNEMPTNGPLWEQLRSDKAIDFLEPGKYSDSLYQVILDMMKSNITERISLDQILLNENIQLVQQKRLNQFQNIDNIENDNNNNNNTDNNNNNNTDNINNDNNDDNNNNINNYNLKLITPYFQYQKERKDEELKEIIEFGEIREIKEKFEHHQFAIPTPHFVRSNAGRSSSSSLFSDEEEDDDDDDDSGRDSPIHFSLNNLNNSSSNIGISESNSNNSFSSILEENNESSSSSPLPSLSFSRRLSTSSLVTTISPKPNFNTSGNKLFSNENNNSNNNNNNNNNNQNNNNNNGFYGFTNNGSCNNLNNLNNLNSSGEFSNSSKKKLGKRGLPLLDVVNGGGNSGSKVCAIKRSFDSHPQESDKMSPRNLLSLFQETN
ncbi:hypothetical protein DDB_G0291133 [Dictyostelium discoideum AX4]|uniref:Probable protein kinase DDB_G0291133 n=1 Tax=Dictyostelium discoideum TaxID=44689 RepID=Y1133_DICDI|nr:hypothetical protein DDB_G0291133 [Dictyostelium discoideum AX4]Q54F40.1 RecName: Full=Probable protein kinase DDB_G0291133 [Dictyostelium discoideum]EAL61850.1 hypothetical protein DDB_G0291133 [Dictyostelium discoideum AX4]|eukprot:XP_635350.1 hypothetical protein DDB_G0291133 [Dictyostelium discoideum AX4]